MDGATDRRVAILAHDKFPDRAKTALGVMRYGEYEVVAVIDRQHAGTRVSDHVEFVPDAPIVRDVSEVADAETLLIGIAPIGGGFDESWRPDVVRAIERGWDIVAGLHEFLNEDEEFARLAIENDATIWDVRQPPPDLGVAEGIAGNVDAQVVLTVGTDCSVGKMTATFELVRALEEQGYDAAAIPTGQTGILIEGWGYPIDRVVSDFVAGAVEELVLERGDEYDILIVEGQGSIVHPAYSAVTCGIVHGSMPDAMVLCHEAGLKRIKGYEAFALPPVDRIAELYEALVEPLSPAPVVSGALHTGSIPDDERAREAVSELAGTLNVPVTDVIRFGPEPLLEAVL